MYRFFDTAINPPDQRAGTTSFEWSIAGDTEREYVFLAQVVYFIDHNGDGFQQSPAEPFDRSVARIRRCTPMAATMVPTFTQTPTQTQTSLPTETPTPTPTVTQTQTQTPTPHPHAHAVPGVDSGTVGFRQCAVAGNEPWGLHDRAGKSGHGPG